MPCASVIPALARPSSWAHAAFCQPPRPWPAGEELRFKITFGLLEAGEATLRAEGPVNHGGRSCWRLSAEVVTGPVVSSLYKVRDRLESLADTTDLRCLRSRVSIQEGGYHERLEAELDHERGRRHRPARPARLDVAARLPRRARRLVPRPHPRPRRGRHAWRCRCSRAAGWVPAHRGGQARDHRHARPGRAPACVTTASLGSLTPERIGRDIRIWVTDDRRRLPVRIEIAAPVGRFVATLLPESETPPCVCVTLIACCWPRARPPRAACTASSRPRARAGRAVRRRSASDVRLDCALDLTARTMEWDSPYALYCLEVTDREPIEVWTDQAGTEYDPVLYLFCGAFDPADAACRAIIFDDDGGPGSMAMFRAVRRPAPRARPRPTG